MAITRAQQAKQMLQNGGMLVQPGFGGTRQGYRGDAAARSTGAAQSGRADPGDRGDVGESGQGGDQFDTSPSGRFDTVTKEQIQKARDFRDAQKDRPNILERVADLYRKISPIGIISNLINQQRKKRLFANTMDPGIPRDRISDFIINDNDDDNDNNMPIILPPMMAKAPMTTDPVVDESEETEEPFQLARRFRAEGGIMNADVIGGEFDFESARQMYGLGKLVKKVTRTVKKIAKSPVGKAALLYAGGAGLGALGTGTGFAGFKAGLMSPSLMFRNLATSGKGFLTGISKGAIQFPGASVATSAPGAFKLGEFFTTGKGIATAITAASVLPLLGLGTGEEDEEEAQEILRGEGLDLEAIRANPNQYLGRRFRAEGGSMKEPVAKKTMPLLDLDGKEMDLRAEGGFVPIGRMEKADDVPARLSKNEFVFTADAVRNAGDGDVDKGAEVMYNMMKNLESGGDVSEESQGLEGARAMFQTSKRLEEVL